LKKTIFILAIILLVLLSKGGETAYAGTGTPHIIISGDVWLLDEMSGEKLFLLPDTYFARINDSFDAEYYYVTFNGVSGKISRNLVSATGYHTTAKGTGVDMRVSDETYSKYGSIRLRSAPSYAAKEITQIPVENGFYFVGKYPTDSGIWYYINYSGVYGYIESEITNQPVLNIEDFIPESAPVTNTPTDNPDTDGNIFSGIKGSELRIIIIIGLSVPAVLMLFLLFRPSKSRKYYD